jgi:hypothetical protein
MYLLQPEGSNCWLYALANTAIFFGKTPPLPDTPGWEWLMDIGMCRCGACIRPDDIATQLGLEVTELTKVEDVHRHLPGLLSTLNYDGAGGMHISLVIGGNTEELTLVNYRWGKGPVVETLQRDNIPMPDKGNVNRKAYTVGVSNKKPPEVTMCPFCKAYWYINGKDKPWHHTTCHRFSKSKND